MKKLTLILLITLLYFPYTNTTGETKQPNESVIKQLLLEVKAIKLHKLEIKKREQEIFNFKIQFSEHITNIATHNFNKDAYQDNQKKVLVLETNIKAWNKDADIRLLKIKDLIPIVEQSRKSNQEIIKQKKKRDQKIIKKDILRYNSILKDLGSLKKVYEKHTTILGNFLTVLEKWKIFLKKKMKAEINENLFSWELRSFFKTPLKTTSILFDNIKQKIAEITRFNYIKLIKASYESIILFLFLYVTIYLAIIISIKKVSYILKHIDTRYFDPTFETVINIIFENRTSLATIVYILSLNFTLSNVISPYPQIFNFFVYTFTFLTLWHKVGKRVLCTFIKEINKSKKNKHLNFSTIPFIIFIITKTAQSSFHASNDIVIFLNSILLGWISYKLFEVAMRYKIYQDRFGSERIALSIKTFKTIFVLFMGAILASTIIAIAGFGVLGSTIQIVISNDLLALALGWFLYQSINSFLDTKGKSFIKQKNNKLLNYYYPFIRNFFNIMFLMIFILVVIYTWSKTIFIHEDIFLIQLISVGEFHLTLGQIVYLIIAFYIVRAIHLTIIFLSENLLPGHFNPNEKSTPHLAPILRYVFILIYMLVGAGVLGITYRNLIIFASALGVGIGFGLQNIVNNFISGIILLFEQPVRVGDIIEVDGLYATVKRIGIRSTIVESFDNSSVIIPNSEIISNQLTNWTLNNNIIAIKCAVGIEYGSDTVKVSEILKEIAKNHKDVINYPESVVWFEEFGDSSLNFILKVWINKPHQKFNIHSSIMHLINSALEQNNITIPFPQSDIHIKDGLELNKKN